MECCATNVKMNVPRLKVETSSVRTWKLRAKRSKQPSSRQLPFENARVDNQPMVRKTSGGLYLLGGKEKVNNNDDDLKHN